MWPPNDFVLELRASVLQQQRVSMMPSGSPPRE
jgi:hypothetical protein